MSRKWRWDQGRLDYFQLEEVRRLATALWQLNGIQLPRGEEPDVLRHVLSRHSERPFLPGHYKVWRNYKRVFACQLLATELDDHIACTELCEKLVTEQVSYDEYLIYHARHFYYPSPVFDDYDTTASQIFPVCAILKFVISRYLTGGETHTSLEEIIERLKGNGADGTEPISSYMALPRTGYSIDSSNDEFRQIREMTRFISQFSFLKWDNPNLILDVENADEALAIGQQLEPQRWPRNGNPSAELLNIGGKKPTTFNRGKHGSSALDVLDREFSEGKKSRVSHLQTERSIKLRELYFAYADEPSVCNMCRKDTLDHYPWAMRLIEVHHLLPLGSPLRVAENRTSLKDVAGLCPSCHRATHKYYAQWLNDQQLNDFRGATEAREVYDLAKEHFHA